jgi:hypothetical protein
MVSEDKVGSYPTQEHTLMVFDSKEILGTKKLHHQQHHEMRCMEHKYASKTRKNAHKMMEEKPKMRPMQKLQYLTFKCQQLDI